MALMDFLKRQLIDIIEWTDDSRDTLSYRFPDDDKEIKNGAQLIVRESQVVQFVYLGEFGDTFGPGKHTLTTDNIPILTNLKSWKYGFESPFKADVYYVTTRLFTGQQVGHVEPDHGARSGLRHRARAGLRHLRLPRSSNRSCFSRRWPAPITTSGSTSSPTRCARASISVFSDALATAKIPVLDLATRYQELGDALLPLINPLVIAKYGIEIATFVLENASVPAEVEAAIDKRSSMSAIGNLNDYVKYQMAQGMEKGGSAGGAATEMAVGLAMAQQIVQQQQAAAAGAGAAAAPAAPGVAPASLPELLTPADVAKRLGVGEEDVLSSIQSGDLKAKKIGSAYRVTRGALEEFLKQ